MFLKNWDKPVTAGLYIHIPFCKAKCKYCGFYSIASDNDTINKYIDIVIREMEKIQSKDIDTVYIGGGTPSILGEYQLEKLLNAVNYLYLRKRIMPMLLIYCGSKP